MKNIHKEIFMISVEIVVIFGLVVASFFWWKSFDLVNYVDYAAEASKNNVLDMYLVESIENYNLFPLSDEKAIENISPGVIRVSNYSSTPRDCSLVLMLYKSSTLEYHFLKVSINNRIYSLKDMIIEDDEEYYYFIFENSPINDYIDYEIRIWMDSGATTEDAYHKNLEYSFSLRDNTALTLQ